MKEERASNNIQQADAIMEEDSDDMPISSKKCTYTLQSHADSEINKKRQKKEHVCDKCGKDFTQHGHLISHMRIHNKG